MENFNASHNPKSKIQRTSVTAIATHRLSLISVLGKLHGYRTALVRCKNEEPFIFALLILNTSRLKVHVRGNKP